jgi:hypothetical protein
VQNFVLKVEGIDGRIKLKLIFIVQMMSMQTTFGLGQNPFKK